MKYYSHHQDLLQNAQNHIITTVSPPKWTHLDPALSVRQWIINLKNNTKPPRGYMLAKTKKQYNSHLKAFKLNRMAQWLDEWEAIMVDCIKYAVPDILNGGWLRDLADLMIPISNHYQA